MNTNQKVSTTQRRAAIYIMLSMILARHGRELRLLPNARRSKG